MSMCKYVVFKVVLALYHCLNTFTGFFFGFSFFSGNARERAHMDTDYDRSAHILNVKWRMRKFELEGPNFRKHFLLRHERYTHPDVVLSPDVTLMSIDSSFAVFAVCDKNKHDVLSHTTGPFMYINQFNHCSQVIRMPLQSFLKLSEHVGDPLAKLVILSNTGRCGSTLLTQLYEELPNTVAISEPEVLMAFTHEPTFDKETMDRKHQLIRGCVRLLCKDNRGHDTKCVLIKPKAHAIALTKDLAALYPNASHLYMYRHPAEYVRSLISVYKSLLHPLARSLLLYLSFAFDIKEFIMRQFAGTKQQYRSIYEARMEDALTRINLRSRVKRFTALFCGNLLAFLQLAKEENIPFLMVSYHELKDDTDKDMKRILRYCQLGCLVGDNVEVLLPENDSQTNSGLSRKALKTHKESLTDKEVNEIDVILRDCGFPSCSHFPLESHELVKELEL